MIFVTTTHLEDLHHVESHSRFFLALNLQWYDLFLIILLGWFLVPAVGIFHIAVTTKYTYDRSWTKLVANHIQQLAQLATLVYIADIIVVALVAIGFDFDRLSVYSLGFARLLYVGWVAQRLSVLKKHFLDSAAEASPHKLGQLGLIDKLVDGILYICTGFMLLDILDVQMGVGLSSVFAFGSAGTLIIGLASKDLADMFINGVAMTTADRVREGDWVTFGDGTSGQIVKIGWMLTTIRHSDELVEVIPNSKLGLQRVTNLSRVDRCQVKTDLRFKLKDANKMAKLCDDTLSEIKASCPETVTDDSRPFRCVWTDIKEYYLNVMVEAHFTLPSMGAPYWNNRMEVMKAIYRVVEKNGLEFAEPPNMSMAMKD